jgi:hypothetical protein
MLDGAKAPDLSRGFHLNNAIYAAIVQPGCGGIGHDSTEHHAALT